jgi:hypothetical protein
MWQPSWISDHDLYHIQFQKHSVVFEKENLKKNSQLEFSAMVAMLNIRLTLKSQNMMQSMKGAFLQILFLFGSVVSQKMSA